MQNKSIRVALIGVGNCASALYQGLHYYRQRSQQGLPIPGIMSADIGGYALHHIHVAAAIDIDPRKVGKPLASAIFAEPNCARKFHLDLDAGPDVIMGPVLDGFAQHMLDYPEHQAARCSTDNPVDVVQLLQDRAIDIVINYLPVGSVQATEFYAQAAINAGVAFMNCMPVLSINSQSWEKRFIDAGLPLIGSDMKSQFGASILSQIIQELAHHRGMTVDFHSQVNFGGNTDFLVMTDASRLAHKKVSKENVIRAQNAINDIDMPHDALYAGPAAYVPYLRDNKIAHFDVRMRGFADAEVTLDCKLSVQDSENSAGVVIDAVRYLQVARELGIMGNVRGASAITQKSPPLQLPFDVALAECQALARRELTDMTRRQTSAVDAWQFCQEQHAILASQPAMKPYVDLMNS